MADSIHVGLNITNTITRTVGSNNDALDRIDRMLSKYIEVSTRRAEALAQEISEKSKAIAEINRLWGIIMTENISKLDPTKTSTTTNIQSNSGSTLAEIDSLIKNTLKDPMGITAITNGRTTVNYDQLQSMNATLTAFTDTNQVDIDKLQQDFKNMMTAITSAQEETRNVRQAIIGISQR